MNLDHLLQAGLNLEKRIALDQALRQCFSQLWRESDAKGRQPANTMGTPHAAPITLELPIEMCRKLEACARETGKTPAQILQESFALYLRARARD